MKKTLNINGAIFDLSTPKVMGVLNATPDSFYDKSRLSKSRKSLESTINNMVTSGVDIIDVGGYSTRPGADDVSVAEEINRVLPIVKLLKKLYPNIPIFIPGKLFLFLRFSNSTFDCLSCKFASIVAISFLFSHGLRIKLLAPSLIP
jgi:hypothetical protein